MDETGGLAALFEQMRPELTRFLAARCGEAVLAQDLLQDLWLRTVERPVGVVTNARAYLFRAANNLVLDYRRSQQRSMVRDRVWIEQDGGPTGAPEAPDLAPRADEQIEQQQDIALLRAAVDSLPPGAQTALRLYRFEGLSQPEVATRMGISRSGVEKHLALAMRHLRNHLAGANGTEPLSPFSRPTGTGLQQDSHNDRG